MDCTDRAVWKRLGIKAGRSFRIFVVPDADRVLGNSASGRFRFHMTREFVVVGLPPTLLLLDRMRRLAVKGDADVDAFRAWGELDFGLAIAERVVDLPVLDDLGVRAGEVAAHAAVLGLHARGERAA